MRRPIHDPLSGIDRLLVDATNLLFAIRRSSDAEPPAALIGRMRAAIPAAIAIELVFDGPPEPGSRGRIAGGLTVRYGGTRSADELILALLTADRPASGSEPTVLVVTDDAELRRAATARGAATARAAWLLGRLDRIPLAAPSVGRRRPPPTGTDPERADAVDDADARRWRPGRGATVKRGNPRRRRRRADGRDGGH